MAAPGDGGHWAAARLYPIAAGDKEQPDGSPLMETAKEIAAVLGGRNLIMLEGLIYFVTPSGRAELDRKIGAYGLLCLYSDYDTEAELTGFASTPAAK